MISQVFIESDKFQARRERYLNLAVPVRLGELAESLAFAIAPSGHPLYLDILTKPFCRRESEVYRLDSW
jgi:hypothetical protein